MYYFLHLSQFNTPSSPFPLLLSLPSILSPPPLPLPFSPHLKEVWINVFITGAEWLEECCQLLQCYSLVKNEVTNVEDTMMIRKLQVKKTCDYISHDNHMNKF